MASSPTVAARSATAVAAHFVAEPAGPSSAGGGRDGATPETATIVLGARRLRVCCDARPLVSFGDFQPR